MSNENTIGTPEQLSDPDYTPPLGQAIPLGIQHVLAMFASNVTPAFIIAAVAGLALPDKIFLIQMAMVLQTMKNGISINLIPDSETVTQMASKTGTN